MKGKRVLSAVLATAFALSSGITVLADDNTAQPELEARVKNIITVDGYQFKDLNGNDELDPYEDWRLSAEERAADLVSKMTLAEKTGQMVIHTKSTPSSESGRNPSSDADIQDRFITHFVERASTAPSNIATYHNNIQALAEGTRLGIPALWASNPRNENNNMLEFGFQEDVGTFSTFPSTLGIAAAVKGDVKIDEDDYSLIEDFAEIVQQEWNAAGINKGYTYMADLAADPRWSRNNGTFGDDPEFIGEIMYRLIQGLQNGDTLSPGGVAQTTKHFPGGGAPLNGMDPHYAAGKWSVFTTPGSLENYHLVPWRRVVEANSSSIMPYYSQPHPDSAVQVVDGVELDFVNNPYGNAFNPEIVGTLLRDILDYQGYVNSDSNILVDKHWGFEDRGRPNQDRALAKEVIVAAVNAGTDMFSNYNALTGQFATQDIIAEAVNEGLISQERVDEAAYRILIETFRVGYFENPYRDPELADAAVNDSDHWAKAYEAHQKSVVLLKNSDDVLPLTEDKLSGKTVYVEAFNTTAANSNSSTASAREAVETAFNITLTDDYTEADYAILFLYPASGMSQSSAPTAYPDMSFYQDRTLPRRDGNETVNYTTLYGADKLETIYSDLSARGGKVITSMNFRTSWVVDQAERNTDALLVGFDTYLAAILDVISGEYNPTGALPFALPANDEVLAIDESDACASPNDVPGHFKSLYMDGDYVYVDEMGNEYTVDFGLHYGDDVGGDVPVTSIDLNAGSLNMLSIGKTLELNPTITPDNATDKTVTYTSNNPNVASVDENGVVTAHKTGTALITATASNSKVSKTTVRVTY